MTFFHVSSMVDKIDKALAKLSDKERSSIRAILIDIQANKLVGLDVKKLKGHSNIFRVRMGRMRIIFRNVHSTIHILTVERRNDNTY